LEIRNAAKANRGISEHFDDGDKGLLKVITQVHVFTVIISLATERF
jgi:hypothetical protein